MVTFRKHALSLNEQIQTLTARGLVVTDPVRAKRYLKNISYFRLSAYTRPFYIPGSGDDHRFIAGTSFDDVLNLYIFDRELETFLESYQRKYPDSPVQPPLWMALELLSFKQISELFANLR
uniref:Abi family protein n=1 Tax=Endozoicomonas sp. SESOKO1 TaxID=2828742 RepID=UPI002147A310